MNYKGWDENKLIELQECLYEEGKEATSDYIAIEAELDRQADLYNNRPKATPPKAFIKIEARFKTTSKSHLKNAMIAEFGELYADYYDISESEGAFIVISNARKRPIEMFYSTLAEAQKQLRSLLYWRIYDRHFRDGGNFFDINRLKTRLKETENVN